MSSDDRDDRVLRGVTQLHVFLLQQVTRRLLFPFPEALPRSTRLHSPTRTLGPVRSAGPDLSVEGAAAERKAPSQKSI
jgi:hypothetical protein